MNEINAGVFNPNEKGKEAIKLPPEKCDRKDMTNGITVEMGIVPLMTVPTEESTNKQMKDVDKAKELRHKTNRVVDEDITQDGKFTLEDEKEMEI